MLRQQQNNLRISSLLLCLLLVASKNIRAMDHTSPAEPYLIAAQGLLKQAETRAETVCIPANKKRRSVRAQNLRSLLHQIRMQLTFAQVEVQNKARSSIYTTVGDSLK